MKSKEEIDELFRKTFGVKLSDVDRIPAEWIYKLFQSPSGQRVEAVTGAMTAKEASKHIDELVESLYAKIEAKYQEIERLKGLVKKAHECATCDLPTEEEEFYWQQFKAENNL